MLNRFQFARLRGFRRGKKKDRATETAAHRGASRPVNETSADAASRGSTAPAGSDEIRDRWNDDDRVARLLERRAAIQDADREAARERMGAADRGAPSYRPHGGGGPTADRSGGRTAGSANGAPGSAHGASGSAHGASGTADAGSRSADRRAGDRTAAGAPGGGPAGRLDSRTTTIPAPQPATRPLDVTGPVPDALDDPSILDRAGVGGRPGPGQIGHDRAGRGGSATGSARVVCIASGKGGTGKSVLATNLALIRARRGERVLLVDFDAGLANDHLLLGLAPPYDVGHVMTGEVSAQEALVDGPGGIKLLAGGVGRQAMIDPTRRELDRLFKALAPLEAEFDLILIDHGAGLSYSTVAHLAATSTLILVTNHEVTALSDGYALYKRAHMVNHGIRVGLVVNRAPDETIARGAWERFRGASHKFLGHTPELIGWVPVDPAIPQAVQMRSPAAVSFPGCDAVQALERVADWGPIEHARSATPFYERARRALR